MIFDQEDLILPKVQDPERMKDAEGKFPGLRPGASAASQTAFVIFKTATNSVAPQGDPSVNKIDQIGLPGSQAMARLPQEKGKQTRQGHVEK
jgi:hypothetical protein